MITPHFQEMSPFFVALIIPENLSVSSVDYLSWQATVCNAGLFVGYVPKPPIGVQEI